MKKGTLREWSKEEGFSNPPTPEELVAKFGVSACLTCVAYLFVERVSH